MTHIRLLQLDAEDLYSKWGFGDGDICSMVEANFFTDEEFEKLCDYDPLENLVRKYLVPEIERVTNKPFDLRVYETHHNPMRANGWENGMPAIMSTISVTVTHEQIMDCCREL